MADSYIPMRTNLADDVAVIEIGVKLQLDTDQVIGKLYNIWAWAHANLRAGRAPHVPPEWVSQRVLCPGFAEAMIDAQWLEDDGSGGIIFPKFDRWNSYNAKARTDAAERMARSRAGRGGANTGATGVAPVSSAPRPGLSGRNARCAQGATKAQQKRNDGDATPGSAGCCAPGATKAQQKRNQQNNTSAVVLIDNNKEAAGNGRAILESLGFDAKAVGRLCAVAADDGSLIARAVRNADHLDADGALENRLGYIRTAIERRYPLLPALVELDRRESQSQRRVEREQAERNERIRATLAGQEEKALVEAHLRGMSSDDLAAAVKQALVETTPFTRGIIGDCRDPFESAPLRALVWGVVQPTERPTGVPEAMKAPEGKVVGGDG